MQLKKVTIDDMFELQQISFEAYIKNFADHWNANGLELYLEKEFGNKRLKTDLNNPLVAYHFIQSDMKTVGFLKINYETAPSISIEDNCELEKMYILPEYQGLGIGKAALKVAINKIQKRGKKILFLCVIETNRNAIAFYEKLGFKFHSKTRLEDPHFKEELKGMNRLFLELDKPPEDLKFIREENG